MWWPSSFYYKFSRECRGGENKISNVNSFYHFCDRVGAQPPSLNITMLIFLVKNGKRSFQGSLYFEKTRKNFKSNLVLVLESKGL